MSITKAVAIGAAVVASTFAISAADASTPAGQTACPSGMVCLYHGTTKATGIQHGWATLGAHPYSAHHSHLIVNNLWDHRKLTLWGKPHANGKLVKSVGYKHNTAIVDMDRVHSINMQKKCPVKTCFTKVPQ
jgi:hypothetical protein